MAITFSLLHTSFEKASIICYNIFVYKGTEWYTVEEASCLEEGKEQRDCENCSHNETRTIEAKGHKEGDWIVDLEPTKEFEGSKHKECLYCQKILKEQDIPEIKDENCNFSFMNNIVNLLLYINIVAFMLICFRKKG